VRSFSKPACIRSRFPSDDVLQLGYVAMFDEKGQETFVERSIPFGWELVRVATDGEGRIKVTLRNSSKRTLFGDGHS